jgi:hypothetical protein
MQLTPRTYGNSVFIPPVSGFCHTPGFFFHLLAWGAVAGVPVRERATWERINQEWA